MKKQFYAKLFAAVVCAAAPAAAQAAPLYHLVRAATGEIIGHVTGLAGSHGVAIDTAAFDPARKRAFSSNRDGTLSVISEVSATKFVALPPVETVPGARTMTVDPATGRVFLVSAKVQSASPPQQPGAAPFYSFVPGSVRLLVYAPAG
jgi:hypothetical protein